MRMLVVRQRQRVAEFMRFAFQCNQKPRSRRGCRDVELDRQVGIGGRRVGCCC